MKIDPAAVGTLVDSMSQGNPMVKSVADLLMSALNNDDDDDAHDQRAREARRQRARQRLKQIQRSMTLSKRRNAFVAAALGACECWGFDSGCRFCHGRGEPGFREPNVEAFTALVVPLYASRRAFVEKHLQQVHTSKEPGGSE
jgi:hypothetical protein